MTEPTRRRDGTWVTEAERQRFRRQQWAARTPDQVMTDRLRRNPDGLICCRSCNKRLPAHQFRVKLWLPDGVDYAKCFACLAAHDQEVH